MGCLRCKEDALSDLLGLGLAHEQLSDAESEVGGGAGSPGGHEVVVHHHGLIAVRVVALQVVLQTGVRGEALIEAHLVRLQSQWRGTHGAHQGTAVVVILQQLTQLLALKVK